MEDLHLVGRRLVVHPFIQQAGPPFYLCRVHTWWSQSSCPPRPDTFDNPNDLSGKSDNQVPENKDNSCKTRTNFIPGSTRQSIVSIHLTLHHVPLTPGHHHRLYHHLRLDTGVDDAKQVRLS